MFEFGKSICFREGFGGFCFSETGDDDDDDNEDARTCSYTSPICFSLLPNFLLEHAPQLFFSLPQRFVSRPVFHLISLTRLLINFAPWGRPPCAVPQRHGKNALKLLNRYVSVGGLAASLFSEIGDDDDDDDDEDYDDEDGDDDDDVYEDAPICAYTSHVCCLLLDAPRQLFSPPQSLLSLPVCHLINLTRLLINFCSLGAALSGCLPAARTKIC